MIKKNYIQTIDSHNPQRLFTFSDISSFIAYDGVDIKGAIFDENTNAILTPVLTYLRDAPKEINLFGPSVIANEITNQSLAISGAIADFPYNVAYTSKAPTTEATPDSSFSVQFEIPDQTMNNETTIERYSTPTGKIITDTNTTVIVESVLHGDYWYLPIVDEVEWGGVKSFTLEVRYKSELIHFDEYYIEMAEFIDRFDDPADVFNLLTNTKLMPVFGSVMPTLPNKASGPIGDFKWAYGNVNNDAVYMIDVSRANELGVIENVKVIYGEGDLVFYGTIKERIDILEYSTTTLGKNSNSNKTTDIAHCDSFKVSTYYDDGLWLLISHTYPDSDNLSYSDYVRKILIEVDTSYTLVSTSEQYSTNGNIKWYLNGEMIFTTSTNGTNTFTNSDIRIGSDDSIKTVPSDSNLVKNWEKLYLIYYHNSVTVFIDNVSVIPTALSARDVYIMYIRTMTYRQLLLTFNPRFHTVFDKPQTSYRNDYGSNHGSDRFDVKNFDVNSVDVDSEVYTVGTRFTGSGSLIHKNSYSNYTDTTSLINFNSSFSIVVWMKTETRNFLLFSERDKSGREDGLSVFVEGGYITHMFGDRKHKTDCFVSDGSFKMLGISYDGTSIQTFVPLEHDSTYPAALSNGISPRYVTLLNDKGIDTHVDIVLCAFTTFGRVLNSQQFTDLYNESIDFSVVGTVLYENLPAYSEVRIIEHSTGELLDVQQTDIEGRFKYTSIYKNDIDIVTLNNGRLQVIGTIQSTTR